MNLGKRILVVYYHHLDDMREMRLAVKQHIQVLEHSRSEHQITYYNAQWQKTVDNINDRPGEIPVSLQGMKFDVILLHCTFLGLRCHDSFFIDYQAKHSWLKTFNALKIALPQDEYYRNTVLDDWFLDWGVSVIFSTFDINEHSAIYPRSRHYSHFKKCLTGYIDPKSSISQVSPIKDRKLDIVYRTIPQPFHFGKHSQLKQNIGEIIKPYADKHNLRTDISAREEDTIYSEEWLGFLASSKTTLGTESGSSVLDRYGENHIRVNSCLLRNHNSSFEDIDKQMPQGWDDYSFLAISPRHFEAIMTKTCQILVEGYYDGILVENKHYLSLKPDFSNIDIIMKQINDHDYLQSIADIAYDDIYQSGKYTYETLAEEIDNCLMHHKKEITMSENSQLKILERQLVAERSQNTFLQTKLLEMKEEIGILKGILKSHNIGTFNTNEEYILAKILNEISQTQIIKDANRIALYGAGKHTMRVLHLNILPKDKIIAIFDDSPTSSSIFDIPVSSTKNELGIEYDILIVSSDVHEEAMLEKAKEWIPKSSSAFGIYNGDLMKQA